MRVDDIALEMNELLHAEDPEAAGAIGVDLNDGIEDLPVYRHRSRNKRTPSNRYRSCVKAENQR